MTNKIAEIRETLKKAKPGPWVADDVNCIIWSENGQDESDSDIQLIFNAPEWLRFLLDELERLEREYAEERAAHNAHVTELLDKEAKLNQAVEALEWIVECGTDYQSINKARNALHFIKGGEKDE